MIKFLPLDYLGVSLRISLKNKNVVCRLEISALVPEIIEIKKCVKYAKEMIGEVLHSTQYYFKHLKWLPIVLPLHAR